MVKIEIILGEGGFGYTGSDAAMPPGVERQISVVLAFLWLLLAFLLRNWYRAKPQRQLQRILPFLVACEQAVTGRVAKPQ